MATVSSDTTSVRISPVELGNMAEKYDESQFDRIPQAITNQLIVLNSLISIQPLLNDINQLDGSIVQNYDWQCAMLIMLKELKDCLFTHKNTPNSWQLTNSQINFLFCFVYQPQCAVMLLLGVKKGLDLNSVISSITGLGTPIHSLAEIELILHITSTAPIASSEIPYTIQMGLSIPQKTKNGIDRMITIHEELQSYIARNSLNDVVYEQEQSRLQLESLWKCNQQLWQLLSETTVAAIMDSFTTMLSQYQAFPFCLTTIKQVVKTFLSEKGNENEMEMAQWLNSKECSSLTNDEREVISPLALSKDTVLSWIRLSLKWKQLINITLFLRQHPEAIHLSTCEDITAWLDKEPNNPELQCTLLFACCQCGDKEHLSYLINELPNWQSFKGLGDQSLLHHACYHDQQAIISDLLQAEHYIDVVDAKGYTPLHYAVKQGNLDCVKRLMAHGACCEQYVENTKQTIFHIAVETGQDHVLAWLLTQKNLESTIISFDAKGFSPAHLAAKLGNKKALILLCFKPLTPLQLNVQTLSQSGHNLMHIAIYFEHQEIIDLLWDKGLRTIETGKKNLLMLATQAKLPSLIHRLMNHNPGFMQAALLTNGVTPLHIAAQNNDYESLAALLSYDIAIAKINQAASMTLLLNVNQHTISISGQVTPLHLAIANHSNSALQLLLSIRMSGSTRRALNCNLSLKDEHNCYPIHIAALTANQVAIKKLLDNDVYIMARLELRVDETTVELYTPWGIAEKYWPTSKSRMLKKLFKEYLQTKEGHQDLPNSKISMLCPDTKKGSEQIPFVGRRRIPRRLT
ncbi:ankyrin repeat domain-containing protein [Parashewanella curva]|uniref:Ankyrin repeat domain-containing protein n=1 Tax=Parashewanella curva TaxID=2338552 RepID=A0A3L8PZN9_9GAMM|nr:ankyrin repeat domain-containing protein [Parashewanella curva]RLV60821.1 ankyrin repeat domain-containing protein [Parashewanella curva]